MTEKEQVEKIIKEIFALMDFKVAPTIREVESDNKQGFECTFVIKTSENAQYFIGHHGANLSAIEHLAHVIARQKKIALYFKIDVNDYREGKKQMFERIARDAAEGAARSKKPIVLRPMSAYERRLIHTIIASDDRVTTDSIGDGEDRKVVVKPVGIIASL